MSELFDGYDGDEDEREIDEDDIEIDAAAVAHLDQEEAAWEQQRAAFTQVYGFDHQCHCSQDYTSGRLKTVTECFMNLTNQAMQRSAEATHELRLMGALVEELLKLNNDLVELFKVNGLEKELEEYFNQETTLDEDIVEELEGASDAEEPEAEELDDADGTSETDD